MKILATTIDNEHYVQVFVTKEELKDKKIQSKIDELKKNENKVAIFISGKEKMMQIIKENINYTFVNA